MVVCNTCPLSLTDLINLVENRQEDDAWNIAVCHGLAKNTTMCPQCHNMLNIKENQDFFCVGTHWSVTEDFDVVEKKCDTLINGRRGTLFEHASAKIAKFLAFIWYFLDNERRVKDALGSLRFGNTTASRYNSLFREIILHYCVHNCRQIGGPGRIVTVHWLQLAKRRAEKYPWAVRGKFMLAGVENVSRESFVILLEDCSVDSLILLIKQWICPGSVIISDYWWEFSKLSELGFAHRPYSWLEEQEDAFMSSWVTFRTSFRSFYRRESIDMSLSESIFSFQWPNASDRFHQFLLAAAKVFPPKD